MDSKRTLEFLKQIATHNNREWFADHRAEYDDVRADFLAGVDAAIGCIATVDPAVASAFAPTGRLTARDCCYRFNRDTRFSPDKSPYKTHLGAYICEGGRKSLRGGYYIQLEWDRCLVAFGSYWLPTPILTACRTEIAANIDRWRSIVEAPEFVTLFGRPNSGVWHDGHSAAYDYDDTISPQGFGIAEPLKTVPKGFARDADGVEYLRLKDYCVWRTVGNDFFDGDAWLDTLTDWARVAQPMVEFVNAVVRDYD